MKIFLLFFLAVYAQNLLATHPVAKELNTAGTDISPPKAVDDFTLTSHENKSVKLSDFKGQWVLLFFGFTRCATVCPLTMSYITNELKNVPSKSKLQVLFVSVDPKNDTPDQLKKYLASFDKSYIGMTGKPDQIVSIAKHLGSYFATPKSDDVSGLYHSPYIYLINPEGSWQTLYKYPLERGVLSKDLAKTLSHH